MLSKSSFPWVATSAFTYNDSSSPCSSRWSACRIQYWHSQKPAEHYIMHSLKQWPILLVGTMRSGKVRKIGTLWHGKYMRAKSSSVTSSTCGSSYFTKETKLSACSTAKDWKGHDLFDNLKYSTHPSSKFSRTSPSTPEFQAPFHWEMFLQLQIYHKSGLEFRHYYAKVISVGRTFCCLIWLSDLLIVGDGIRIWRSRWVQHCTNTSFIATFA